MLTLSVRQPWAWLLSHGFKDVENRDWATNVRGETLIHAAKRFDVDGYDWVRATFPTIPMPEPGAFDLGGVVGAGRIVDCVNASVSPWFFGNYGFVFTDQHPTIFWPVRGQLGFFEVDASKIKRDRASRLAPLVHRTVTVLLLLLQLRGDLRPALGQLIGKDPRELLHLASGHALTEALEAHGPGDRVVEKDVRADRATRGVLLDTQQSAAVLELDDLRLPHAPEGIA